MRAVRNTADGVQTIDVAPPDPATMTDPVMVEPVSVGICGSDLHVIAMGPSNTTIGHEIAALHDGRPVAIQPMAFCGSCDACRRGDHHMCSVGGSALHGLHIDGGMAEQLVVERQCLVDLPDGVDVRTASLVEPVAVAVHAVNKAAPEAGMRVAVVGAGPIGLVAGAVARSHGVDVDIVARHPHQFDAAEQLGLRARTFDDLGRGYDLVIDGAGTESSLHQSITAVRPAGTVIAAGIYWGDITVAGLALGLKEVQLRTALYWGHHDGEREFDIAARLFGRLPELPAALISHRYELERASEAFDTAAARAAGAIKVVVDVT